MEQIIKYIQQKYKSLFVILYGSYANGTNDTSSDFDAEVISLDYEQTYDISFVNGTQLDVFVYPLPYLKKKNMNVNILFRFLIGNIHRQ